MHLILGATGTVGSEVVKQLLEAGQPVRSFVRDPAKAAWQKEAGAELAEGDFEDEPSLRAALSGVTSVFLLTPGDPRQDEIQSRIIDLAKEAGAKRVVKLSSLGASPDSSISLARHHFATERHLARSGLEYTLLRPTVFMQNLLMNAHGIVQDSKVYAPLGDARIAMVHAADIAAVAVAALTEEGHSGETYNITGPESLSYGDLAEQLSEALGREITYVDIPIEAADQSMRQMGLPDWLADDMTRLNRAFSQGAGELVTDSVSRAAHIEGRRFRDFAQEFSGAFQSQA